jgi:hypothetical protein
MVIDVSLHSAVQTASICVPWSEPPLEWQQHTPREVLEAMKLLEE